MEEIIINNIYKFKAQAKIDTLNQGEFTIPIKFNFQIPKPIGGLFKGNEV